ncbi:MAG: hypothetical protein JST85_05985 [Acidobacteria bacterium]|nr:hypothetical protein [Acidobacteriota bacterium]
MKLKSPTLLAVAIALCLSVTSLSAHAFPQKKKKKSAAENSPPTVKLETSAPAQAPAPTEQAASPAGNSASEKDPQREAWRINVEPYAIIGSGRPGKGAADFDKPDGVAFTPNGWLLATDAKNHRIQVWDVKTKARLGEFGHGIVGGEVVDIAVTPSGMVLVTDQLLNLAYAFRPPKAGETNEKGKPLAPYEYQFAGTRFGEQGFDKLGGIAVDSRGRTYAVDAHLNNVFRFTPEFKPDAAWHFERSRADGNTYLHGCEGIAIDEANGQLFIASEKDSIIQVFDWETGAYKGKLIGANKAEAGAPTGKSVFSGSVEGLALANGHLLAVDESVGHIQVFDIAQPSAFNMDLEAYSVAGHKPNSGYKGFFGHSPTVDFEDKNNKALQQQVKDGSIIPGQANPPGYFCSPDSIASFTDKASGESYIAIADQCNFRLAVYRWSDISKAIAPVTAVNHSKSTEQPDAAAGKTTKKKGKKKH